MITTSTAKFFAAVQKARNSNYSEEYYMKLVHGTLFQKNWEDYETKWAQAGYPEIPAWDKEQKTKHYNQPKKTTTAIRFINRK